MNIQQSPFFLALGVVMGGFLACSDGSSASRSATSEDPRFATIPDGVEVGVYVKTSGCYDDVNYRLQLTGGDPMFIEVVRTAPTVAVGTTELSRSAVDRLDRTLDIYRAASPSSRYDNTVSVRIAWPDHTESLQVNGWCVADEMDEPGKGPLLFHELGDLAHIDG